MKLTSLGQITNNLNSKRVPLNSVQRARLAQAKLYPYIGANNVLEYIDEYIFDEKILCIAEDGGSWGANEVCAKIYKEKCWVNNHAHVLTEKSDAKLEYIEAYLNYANLNPYITGATRGKLTRSKLDSITIPLPRLNDQIRIAHLLGKVEGLIAQRKQHLQQLDELLKSVFLEMFGDPVRNEKGWDKKPFSDLLSDIESGKSPKCEARPATEEEWGVLKLGAVTRCVFDANENKALPVEISPTVKHEVKAGDLLFSRKNTYELVAACAYVYETRPRLLMPDLIFRFVFKEDAEVNPIYIWKLLTNDSQRKAIQAFAAGAAGSMPNISKANLKTAQLPIPPIELQNQFTTIVEKVESLKSRYQQSLSDLESLYGALSQKAFKGELDLSKVPIPESDLEENEKTLEQDLIKLHEQFKILPEIQESLVTLGHYSLEFERMMAVSEKAVEAASITNELSVIPELNESIMAAQKIMKPLNLPQYAQLQKISDLTKTITDLHKTLGAPFEKSLPSQKYFDSMESLLKVTDQFKLPTSMEKNIMFIDSIIPQPLKRQLDFFNRMLPSGLTNTALDESPLSDPQRREDLLKRVFDSHLSQLNTGDTFSLDDLWQTISIRTLDDQEDDTPPIGPADYELVKKWVFEALEADQLKQSRNIVGMDDKGEAIFGNVVELKVGSLQ